MLPSRTVADNLTTDQYQALMLRYQILQWLPQMAQVSKKLVALAPEDSMPLEQRKRLKALMTAAQAGLLVNHVANEVENTKNDLLRLAMSEGGKLLDKHESTARARRTLASAFDFAAQLAGSAVHKVVEDVVLPHVGLPVNYLPEGGSLEQYLTLAARLEKIGYVIAQRDALRKAAELTQNAGRPVVLLATRTQPGVISARSAALYVEGLKDQLTLKVDKARSTFLDLHAADPDFAAVYPRLAEIELQRGDLERASELLNSCHRKYPSYLPAYRVSANLEIATWRIKRLEVVLERMRKLDSESPELKQIENLYVLIAQCGLA